MPFCRILILKEMNQVIKKLKRYKSLGPDKIPNEMFIEADKETRLILKEIMEKIHETDEIPNSWEEGEIIRLEKGWKENAQMKEE